MGLRVEQPAPAPGTAGACLSSAGDSKAPHMRCCGCSCEAELSWPVMPIYLAGVLALARVLRRVTVAGSAVAGVLAAALQTRRHRETRRQDGL